MFRISPDDLSLALEPMVPLMKPTKKDKDSDDPAQFIDIRTVGDGLILTAGSAAKGACSRAPIEHLDGELVDFSLTQAQAKLILAAVGDSWHDLAVEVTMHKVSDATKYEPEVWRQHVKIRELGTLFGGKELALTTDRQPGTHLPEVWAALRRGLSNRPPARDVEVVGARALDVFAAAARCHDTTPRLVATAWGSSPGLIVHVGPRFVGWLWTANEDLDDLQGQRASWVTELPMPSVDELAKRRKADR